MAEPQLVNYIRKAREAGQSDDQTRNLLFKNGWTVSEVSEALSEANKPAPQVQPQAVQPKPQPQVQPQMQQQKPEVKPQPQIKPQPQVQAQQPAQPQVQKVQIKPEPQIVSQPKPQPIAQQPQPKVEFKPQPQVQPQMQQQKPEVKPQPRIKPQPQVSPVSNLSQMKPKSHLFSKILITLIVLVILGGGAFAAINYTDIAKNLFGPKPDEVLNNMLANMKDIKSYNMSLKSEAIISSLDNKTSPLSLSVDINSKINSTDAQNEKIEGSINLVATYAATNSPIGSITANMAIVDGVSYVKLNKISTAGTIYVPGLDLNSVKSTWIEIDQKSLEELSKIQGAQADGLSLSKIGSVELNQKIKALILAESKNLFTFDKQIDNEVLDGQKTYHYLLTIKKEQIKALVSKIIDLQSQQDSSNQQTQDSTGLQTENSVSLMDLVRTLINAYTDAMGDVDTEVWIGENDFMLYKYKIDKSIDLSSLGIPNTLELKFEGSNSNFNGVVAISKPTKTKKLEDVVAPIIKVQQIGLELNKVAIIAQSLSDSKKSYSTLCTRGLLNGYLPTYGKDLVDIHKNIIAQGAQKPSCFANIKDYCVSTQLEDGSYLCLDKNNIIGIKQCTSADTVCGPENVSTSSGAIK